MIIDIRSVKRHVHVSVRRPVVSVSSDSQSSDTGPRDHVASGVMPIEDEDEDDGFIASESESL